MSVDYLCIQQFLSTGCLSELRLGASKKTVESQLGAPENFSNLRRGVMVVAYLGGRLQVTYEKDNVVLIALYFRGSKREVLVPGLNCDFECFEECSRDNFVGILERIGVPYNLDPLYKISNCVCIKVGSEMRAFFEENVLDSIQIL